MEITNHGQIKRLALPDHWLERTLPRAADTLKTVRIAYPADRPNVQLRLIYRGRPLSEAAGKRFQSILSLPPHGLTPDEIMALTPVLRDLADEEIFERQAADTLELNGKKVLRFSGKWKHDPFRSASVFVDVDGSGCTIQEISFFAPDDDWASYLPHFEEMLNVMQWQENGQLEKHSDGQEGSPA